MEDSPVWSLGPLRLDPERPDSSGVLWVLSEETGFFGSPASTASLTQKITAHGAYRTPGWKQQRTISLKGWAFAPTYGALRSAVNKVTGLLGNPYTSLSLTCYSEIGPLTCEVYLDGDILTQPVPASTPIMEWSLQVVAPDPRKYSVDWRTMRAGLPQATTGDGLDFMTSAGGMSTFKGLDYINPGGLMFGASNSTGFLQLTNAGTAPTAPIYTLYGPLTTPVITATTGGVTYTMKYNAAVDAGTRIVIDPSVPSVLLDGTASRRHLLNPAPFAGFYIPAASADDTPGALNVGLTHSGATTSGGYATAQFRNAWF